MLENQDNENETLNKKTSVVFDPSSNEKRPTVDVQIENNSSINIRDSAAAASNLPRRDTYVALPDRIQLRKEHDIDLDQIKLHNDYGVAGALANENVDNMFFPKGFGSPRSELASLKREIWYRKKEKDKLLRKINDLEKENKALYTRLDMERGMNTNLYDIMEWNIKQKVGDNEGICSDETRDKKTSMDM